MEYLADVRPGDIIFVTIGESDPLARFVGEMDGSQFSHCGVVTSTGAIASCRAGASAWSADDSGGIRFDAPTVYTQAGRSLYRGRPTLPASELEAVVRYVEQFAQDGRLGAQESEFSFAKLFLVSCGLSARSRSHPLSEAARNAVFTAALEAAKAASFTQRRPVAFCSEFVSVAFGQGFEDKAFDPPVMGGGGVESEPPSSGLEGFLHRLDENLESAWAAWKMAELVATMLVHDLDHVLEAYATVEEWREWKERNTSARSAAPPPPPPDTPIPAVLYPSLPPLGSLPTALVTPRMLTEASWVGPLDQVAEAEPGPA